MRRFVDLHLCPVMQDIRQIEEMVRKSSGLGYHIVGMPLSVDVKRDKILQLQKMCNDAKIDFVTRTDLVPKTPHELLSNLRRYRRRFEVISVTCVSKSVARQAAKDRRVDLLSFPVIGPRRPFFDHAEAELASRALSSLEIDMSSLLRLRGIPRVHLLSSLRKEVAIANKFHVPIIISSGATDPYLMRQPHDCASLTSLFNMNPSTALRAISEHPITVIERNREKLSPNYVAQGIRVVRRTYKDCLSV